MRATFVLAVVLACLATTLASGLQLVPRKHWEGKNWGPSLEHDNDYAKDLLGKCYAVWDSYRNRCLEGMAAPGSGKTCHRFDVPPKAGTPEAVPKDCYIWRMENRSCLEKAEGVSNGENESEAGPDAHHGGGFGTATDLPKSTAKGGFGVLTAVPTFSGRVKTHLPTQTSFVTVTVTGS